MRYFDKLNNKESIQTTYIRIKYIDLYSACQNIFTEGYFCLIYEESYSFTNFLTTFLSPVCAERK